MNRLVTENCQYGFPGNQKFLDFVQSEQIQQYTQQIIEGVFGKNATGIISGCEVAGNNVSEGIVLINGELLPFETGSILQYVAVNEATEQAIFQDGQNRDAYKRRAAKFSTALGTLWITLDNNRLNIQELFAKRKNPSASYKYLSVDNDYLKTNTMVCHVDDFRNVRIQGSMVFKNVGQLPANDWLTLFVIQESNGAVGKQLQPKYPAIRPEVLFDGLQPVIGNQVERFTFRITANGEFQVFMKDNDLFDATTNSFYNKPIYVNVSYFIS